MSVREKAVWKLESIMERPLKLDAKYEQLIKSIDWNRVILEATSRCLKLHGEKFKNDIDIPCGECIEAALLVKETFPQW